MKRLLSLLVVIAMVVSLIPNVFAAKEEIDMDELLGRLVVLEDISLIEVKLDEGSDGMIYQWTPAEDETAESLKLFWTAPEGTVINVTATTGETTVAGENGELTLPLVAGQLVEIEIAEATGLAAEFKVSGMLAYPLGTETNPISLTGPVEEVTIEKASWFQLYFVGDVEIAGEGAFNVICNGETTAAVDGKATITVAGNPRKPAVFQIDAAGTYTVTFIVPVGTMDNPAALVIGENVADIKAGSQGYVYTWTATEEGTLKITMPAGNWTYTINNMTTYAYGNTQWSDSDPVVNPAEIAVAAGDEIHVIVNTYDPATPWDAPAGQLTIKAELVLPEPPAPAFQITKQPQDTLVDLGVRGEMTVEVEGEVSKYQWQISSDGGETWSNTSITGYNTNTLSIPGTEARHGRMFRCVITPVEGEAVISEAATHNVAFLEVKPVNATSTSDGGTVTFTAKWSVPGATYLWQYKNNEEGAEWTEPSGTSIGTGKKTDTYTVNVRANRNLFSFRCIITYNGVEYKTAEDDAKGALLLIKEDAPEILSQPELKVTRSGDQVQFSVEATGVGVTYQWMCKRPDGTSWYFTHLSGYNTPTLTVRAWDERDGYQYKCKVMTLNGKYPNEVDSAPATLTVNPAADIIEQPQSVTAAAGTTVAFSVVANADGYNLTYQWQWSKNGRTFYNVNKNSTSSTLEVEATAERNGYTYRCIVKNDNCNANMEYGYIYTAKAQLTVE